MEGVPVSPPVSGTPAQVRGDGAGGGCPVLEKVVPRGKLALGCQSVGSCADGREAAAGPGGRPGSHPARAVKGTRPVLSSVVLPGTTETVRRRVAHSPGLIACDFLVHNTHSGFSSRSSCSRDDSEIHGADPSPPDAPSFSTPNTLSANPPCCAQPRGGGAAPGARGQPHRASSEGTAGGGGHSLRPAAPGVARAQGMAACPETEDWAAVRLGLPPTRGCCDALCLRVPALGPSLDPAGGPRGPAHPNAAWVEALGPLAWRDHGTLLLNSWPRHAGGLGG